MNEGMSFITEVKKKHTALKYHKLYVSFIKL